MKERIFIIHDRKMFINYLSNLNPSYQTLSTFYLFIRYKFKIFFYKIIYNVSYINYF